MTLRDRLPRPSLIEVLALVLIVAIVIAVVLRDA